MAHAIKIPILVALVAGLAAASSAAAARGGLYPVTRCGPDQAFLCPIHGYFDQAPFQYNVAIYPGCIKVRPVETPNGIVRRRVLVCG